MATLTRVSLVCTLERAKWVAYNTCVKKGGAAGQFYQDDFHEIAWATNAYLVFAIVERDPLDLPRDYEPVYGWAFAKLANRPPTTPCSSAMRQTHRITAARQSSSTVQTNPSTQLLSMAVPGIRPRSLPYTEPM